MRWFKSKSHRAGNPLSEGNSIRHRARVDADCERQTGCWRHARAPHHHFNQAAGNVRNCREKTVKRFLLSTSLNQGKDSSASFAAGSITITGEGQMAKSEDGKAEAWFDAGLPVSMKFRLIGGRVSVAEGMLPLQHSIIDDTIEYVFENMAFSMRLKRSHRK